MFPGPYPDFPRGHLKRYHDDESSSDFANGPALGFNEHRNKRLQTLPFRTSPNARKRNLPSALASDQEQQRPTTITPPGSLEDTANRIQQQFQQQQQQMNANAFLSNVNPPSVVESVDMDMDMDLAIDDTPNAAHAPTATPGGHMHHLAPGPLQPDFVDDSNIVARIPTPIQPSFSAQVRGSNWGGAAGNVMHSGLPSSPLRAMVGDSAMHPNCADRSVPRSLDHRAAMGEWSMVQNRSLPSPISESGGEDTGSPDMVLDSLALHGHSHLSQSHSYPGQTLDLSDIPDRDGHSEGRLTPVPQSLGSSPVMAQAQMSASSPIRPSSANGDSDTAMTTPKKGHARSRHTLIPWTQQPGMKKSFSIGYRADCEKCRNRVPGHFNHIIVS